jgi:hypothetical protein
MHLTLKLESTKPAARNFLQQQAKFDDFIDCYNNERPRQALNMQCPVQRYRPSPRPYRGLPDIEYPFHDRAATVTTCGRICFNRQKINLSQVFAGQTVGIKQPTSGFGSSALRIMISGASMTRLAGSNPLKSLRAKSVTYVIGKTLWPVAT